MAESNSDGRKRQRIGRLIVDAKTSEEERKVLAEAIESYPPFAAEVQTTMRIDVFRLIEESKDND